MKPSKITIELQFGASVTPHWLVTSPQIPGLVASGGTIPDALREAAKAIDHMALAIVHELAEGRVVAHLFAKSE